MINSIQTEAPVGFQLYTGLTNVQVVAVNPTTAEYKALTGRDREMTYGEIGENKVKAVKFIIHNEKIGYQDLDILIGKTPRLSSNGNSMYMNNKGAVTWGSTMEAITSNPKMAWFGTPVLTLNDGEEILHQFLQALCHYNQKDDNAQWVTDIRNSGFDISLIYQGNMNFLRQFIAFYKANYVTVALGVKDTEKGEYQRVITKDAPFYSCWDPSVISKSAYRNFSLMLQAKQAEGYPIQGVNTADFMEYVKEDIPSKPQMDEEDDLPF